MKSMLLGPLFLLFLTSPCLAESWSCSPDGGVNGPIRFTISPPEVTTTVSVDGPYQIIHNDDKVLIATYANLCCAAGFLAVRTLAIIKATGEYDLGSFAMGEAAPPAMDMTIGGKVFSPAGPSALDMTIHGRCLKD
jgi:hypothetical protein